ncbi:MAG TPA: amidase [Candidatus Binataceae bacterium]
MSLDLINQEVAILSGQLRTKQLSPVELTEAYLKRIGELDSNLHAYITVTGDLAREQARVAESEIVRGAYRSPFHGIPIALKDLCYTKGVRTTGGSKILADFVPVHDSTVWARLREAGAILLGKLNLHEFAYGVTSSNPHWGAVRNPYDTTRIPGGSSGGSSAAIVAGMAAATIGSDTGGSIRIPAALCGCVGLKATWSLVSRYGVIPLSATLDHVGPIARSVRDAAWMLKVIAGHDSNDATSSREPVPDYAAALDGDIKGVRIGLIRELSSLLSGEAADSFNAALKLLESLGAMVEEVSIPGIATSLLVTSIITWADALEYHQEWMRSRAADYGEDVRRLLESGMSVTATAYIRAQKARARILSQALDALTNHDVLLGPSSSTTAPKIGTSGIGRVAELEGSVDLVDSILRFTTPFNATGQPALALPTGLSPGGLPLSMQIVGRPFDELSVIRVAGAYESARGPLPSPKL